MISIPCSRVVCQSPNTERLQTDLFVCTMWQFKGFVWKDDLRRLRMDVGEAITRIWVKKLFVIHLEIQYIVTTVYVCSLGSKFLLVRNVSLVVLMTQPSAVKAHRIWAVASHWAQPDKMFPQLIVQTSIHLLARLFGFAPFSALSFPPKFP